MLMLSYGYPYIYVSIWDDRKKKVLVFDGFGSSEVLPFSSLSVILGRMKVRRKINRFFSRYISSQDK